MLGNILAILITFGVVLLILWVVETYFPALPKLIKAAILASLILTAIRTLHLWVCGWLCGP
jgi:hypothetical protein